MSDTVAENDVQKKDLAWIMSRKPAGHKISMLTCYDYPTARMQEAAGIDVIFVGDSLGTNMLGYSSEREVTMADMLHHTRAVRRGVKAAFLLSDMPYQSYETPDEALSNALAFIDAGADGVKLEGGQEQAATVKRLADAGIMVCGHIGFTPQTLAVPGKRARIQGRTAEQGITLLQAAVALEEAGAQMLVLELVPEALSKLISEHLKIPTIGIGAGRYCDGQVLIYLDALGMSGLKLHFVKVYQPIGQLEQQAFADYKREVDDGTFPGDEQAFGIEDAELEKVSAWAGREL